MATYWLKWEIEIDADTPREAAEAALAIVRDPESCATCFIVHEDPDDEGVVVDLNEEGGE